MVRAFCLVGMAGGFLMISPNLRSNLVDSFSQAALGIEEHGPYSYVGLGLALMLGLMIYLSRGQAPR